MNFLYRKIYEEFLKKIKDSTYPVGSKLPSEKEISEEYGVSRITSKRAIDELAEGGYVERTRGKGTYVIQRSIFQDYMSNESSPSRLQQNTVYVLLPIQQNMSNLGDFTIVLNNISKVLNNSGYSMQLYYGLSNISPLRNLLEKNHGDKMAGIIYSPIEEHSDYKLLAKLVNTNFPIITFDKRFAEMPVSSVVSENRIGGKNATDYLISLNHRRIAFISDLKLEQTSTIRERFLGYSQALKENNIPYNEDYVIIKEDTSEPLRGYDEPFYKEAITRLLKNGVTAIFCINDLVASFVTNAALNLGYEIPTDFSLVGFDNTSLALYQRVPLTTVAQDFERIGTEIGNLMLHKIKNPNYPYTNIEIPTKLVIRNSCTKFEENSTQ